MEPGPSPQDRKLLPKLRSSAWFIAALVVCIVAVAASQTVRDGSDNPVAATGSASEAAAADDRGIVAGQATELMRTYVSASTACNQVARTAMKKLQAEDSIAAYQAAEEAETFCVDASDKVAALDAPADAEGATRSKFETVLSGCDDAHRLKVRAFGKLKKVINGDQRPSFMIETRDPWRAGRTA